MCNNPRGGDIVSADWAEADLVYVASLCFSVQMVQEIVLAGKRLKVGARLIIFSIPSDFVPDFELEKTIYVNLSCGHTAAYIFKRILVD
jgi:hypothetical protein